MPYDTVSWLHLTDIHAGRDDDAQQAMFNRILEEVRSKRDKGFVPDFVFITGDVANRGQRKDYQFFGNALLAPLYEILGPELKGRTFAVPGNHDVDRGQHDYFDRSMMTQEDKPCFDRSEKGHNARRLLLPRFHAFREFFKEQGDWLDTLDGTHFTTVSIARSKPILVGVVQANTAWLCRDRDDRGKLVIGFNMLESALKAVDQADLRIVLGHHPLDWLQWRDKEIAQGLLAKHRAVYLHGHLHQTAVVQPPAREGDWPICVQGLASYHDRERLPDRNGLVWGQFSPFDQTLYLQPRLWVPTLQDWSLKVPNYPADQCAEKDAAHIALGEEVWWGWKYPVDRRISIEHLFIRVHSTRYTRRTGNGHLVDEHARRAGTEDVGREGLRRSPLLVDEALGFFNRILLLGEAGAGKSIALEKLYTTLQHALEENRPSLILEFYPDWRHAPLPVPIRIDAVEFAEWLASSPLPVDECALMTYAAQEDATPFGRVKTTSVDVLQQTLESQCFRDSFILMVEEWGALDAATADRVWRAIKDALEGTYYKKKKARHVPVHQPVVILAAALDSQGLAQPFAEDEFERIPIARLSKDEKTKFAKDFCRLHSREFHEISALLDGRELITDTPAGLIALLKEWEFAKFDAAVFRDLNWMGDLYELKIEQALRAASFDKGIAAIDPIATALESAYQVRPEVSLLKFSLAADLEPLGEQLVEGKFLRKHREPGYRNVRYSVRQLSLQDYLIAWRLHERRGLTLSSWIEELFRLAFERQPIKLRREPISFALQWCWASAPRFDSVHTILTCLRGINTTSALMAVADFLVLAGSELKPGSSIVTREFFSNVAPHFRQMIERRIHARSELEPGAMVREDAGLSTYDRYILGKALSICGDGRDGVRPNFIGLPEFRWISIAGGRLHKGQTDRDRELFATELRVPPDDEPTFEPGQEPELAGFHLSCFPVTNQQFAYFVEDPVHGYFSDVYWDDVRPRKPAWSMRADTANHPASSVSWIEAVAFCRWFSKASGLHVTLPTSEQWEFAARGPGRTPVFSFGNEKKYGLINSQEEGLPGVCAVGVFPDSPMPEGPVCRDLSGNIFEWCLDGHEEARDDYKISKGGSYNHDLLRCRNAIRGKKRKDSRHPYMGFRVCCAEPGKAPARPRVVLVGGGFAATCTAIRLLALADFPVEIVMVEQRRGNACGGLAYSKENASWEHHLNLQAGRISVFREDRDDLVNWLRYEADRAEWPDRLKKGRFNRSSAVPRRIYQEYLRDRLRQAIKESKADVGFAVLLGDVVAVDPLAKNVTLAMEDGRHATLPCALLILCTGNIQTRHSPAFASILNQPRYLHDQYGRRADEAIQKLCETNGDETNDGTKGGKRKRRKTKSDKPPIRILAVGSALRGSDVVMSFHGRYAEIPTHITLLSRSGLLHPVYGRKHVHEVFDLPEPPFLTEMLSGKRPVCSAPELRDLIAGAYRDAYQSEELAHVPAELRSERILKAWEKYVPRALTLFPKEMVNELLTEFRSLITVKRIGVVPSIGRLLNRAIIRGDCEVMAGEVVAVEVIPGGSFDVRIRQKGAVEPVTLNYDMVINCVGREQNYRKIEHPLWKDLFAQGLVKEPEISTVGVDVDQHGMLIGKSGQVSEWIGGVGVMREGVEFERFGRLGSFSFSLGPLKNQSLEMAVDMLRNLRGEALPAAWRAHARELAADPGCFAAPAWWRTVASECAKRSCGLELDASAAGKELGSAYLAFEKSVERLAGFLQKEWATLKGDLIGRTWQTRQARHGARSLVAELTELVAPQAACQESEIKKAAGRFLLYFEDLLLAHLTRLDVVQPKDKVKCELPSGAC